MAMESGGAGDLDGPNFTIGPPSEPVPQSALRDHHMIMDKGVPFDEMDYQSEHQLARLLAPPAGMGAAVQRSLLERCGAHYIFTLYTVERSCILTPVHP